MNTVDKLHTLFEGVEGIYFLSREEAEEARRACKPTDVALDWTSILSTHERSFALLADDEGGGIIVELGPGEAPMTFDNDESLWKTWAEIHAMFGIPLSEQDQEMISLLEIPVGWFTPDC
jgi:hypothetical protein